MPKISKDVSVKEVLTVFSNRALSVDVFDTVPTTKPAFVIVVLAVLDAVP